MVFYGMVSVKIKSAWYLGEARKYTLLHATKQLLTLEFLVPAVLLGIIVGPLAAKFLDSSEWGAAIKGQQDVITLVNSSSFHCKPNSTANRWKGLTRVVIGVQLVIAGFQLPSKYFYKKWLPMLLCLIPLMTTMWLLTTGCVMITIPKLSLVSPLITHFTMDHKVSC